MALTAEQAARLKALPVEQKTKMLETLRKLFPQQKLSPEVVEKPAGIMPEDAANYGVKSD